MVERFPAVPDLTHCLCKLIEQVPVGRVTTCGDLAEALGDPIAARWVGHYTLHHVHTVGCNCHRIVRAGGVPGGYIAGATQTKLHKLATEGIKISGESIDLERFGFRDFISSRPLEGLRQVQESLRKRIVLRPRRRVPKFIGGVDLSYPRPDLGVAAYALIETETGRLAWLATVKRRIVFPYISSYLSFREIPLLLELLDAVHAAGRTAEILLVDGTGILHPRGAGIASHLGVAASLPTIGITKKLLCGQVDVRGMTPGESRPIVFNNSPVGIALRPTAGSARPLFISPGHRVDLCFSERLVRRLLFGRRLPAPIYWADRISRHEGRRLTAAKLDGALPS